ncbi:hypothetical protein EG329_001727 [Mollisiaceae sp. DMI_Dod_QoI]|nr:hypothetical protein EG329_001727 [Helotiales sp. DMI_Dod_QoI]
MEHCLPIMWWNRIWKSSPHSHSPEQSREPQQEIGRDTTSMMQPIIQTPSADGASTPTYGTMGPRRGRVGSLGSLSIQKDLTPRSDRTSVSPSSMHTYYTPDLGEISHDNVQDFAGVSAHLGQTPEPDYVADGNLTPKESPDEDISEGPTLEGKLWDARIAWPAGRISYFIPYDDLQRLVTIDAVLIELRRREMVFKETELQDKADEILKTARKLFAALVCVSMGECILDFLNEGLNDKDMPFVRVELGNRNLGVGAFRLESRRQPKKVLQCMSSSKWGRSRLEAFNRDQWWVLAPIFKESKKEDKMKKVRHWELEPNRVLPFVEDNQSTSDNSGGYSEVWAVRVHRAHQHLYKGTNPKNPNPKLAIKRLISTKEADFKREIEMLKAFSHHHNPHLIKLLATYSYLNRYHLIFPLAEANLRAYWEKTEVAAFSHETMRWSLTQCTGIASALRSIHEYKTSQPKPTPEPSSDLEVPSSARLDANPFSNVKTPSQAPASNEFEAKFGRHGDIKPENILWSCEDVKDECGSNDLGNLLIADFGLMEFHRKSTRSGVPFDNIPVSPTYEPPERSLKINFSRKYDIWSLGCVYLEFITWLVGGMELLRKFPDAREESNFGGIVYDDTFFSLKQHPNPDPKDPKNGMYAIVRPKVTDWIKDLRNMPRYSQFIHDFLDLVEDRMLKVNQEERLQCSQLNIELANIVKKANTIPGYLTNTKPLDCSGPLKDETTPPSPTDGSALPKKHSLHTTNGAILEEPRPMSPELRLEGMPFAAQD